MMDYIIGRLTVNKYLVFALLIVCLSFNAFAGGIEAETYQGVSMEENRVYTNSNLIDSNSLELQEISSENNENQIGANLVTVEERKMYVLTKTMKIWAMIGGLFVIVFDLLKAVMYIVEIYFMFLILFKLFPNILIRIKDSLTNWYLEKIQ